MEAVSVEPVFGWYAMVPLAIIMLASLWLTLSNTSISFGGRLALMTLRLLAALVLLGWLRPGLVSTSEHESSGALVLLDQSQSMTLPSETASKDRWQVLQDVWSAIVAASDLKIGQTEVVPYVFDQALRPIVAEDLPLLKRTFKSLPNGKLTDIGKVLSELQRTQIDPPLRGVILVSDAALNGFATLRRAASLAGSNVIQLDQPILMVRALVRVRAAVSFETWRSKDCQNPVTPFDKKELNIPLVVKAHGVQGQKIELTLKLRSSGKADRILTSKELPVTASNQALPQNIQIIDAEAGEYLPQADSSWTGR